MVCFWRSEIVLVTYFKVCNENTSTAFGQDCCSGGTDAMIAAGDQRNSIR